MMDKVKSVKDGAKATKYELLDELFALGGNYRLEESKKIETKLRNYMKANDSGEEDLQIRDALIVLKTAIIGNMHNDMETCCLLSVPIFDRLGSLSVWDFYDIRILTCVIHYANSYEQTDSMASIALEKLEEYSDRKQ